MKYIVDWCETKTTSTGKNVKNATLKTENGTLIKDISIWSDFPGWNDVRPGSSVDGEIRTSAKGYKSLSAGKFASSTLNRAPSGAVKAADITRESVKEAQANKNASIAFFNATNSAISLYGALSTQGLMAGTPEEFIRKWRSWFLAEWQSYESGDVTDKTRPF